MGATLRQHKFLPEGRTRANNQLATAALTQVGTCTVLDRRFNVRADHS
jgi:hypothetical protein